MTLGKACPPQPACVHLCAACCSADFKSDVFENWGTDFYRRLSAHMHTASTSIGCVCGKCGAPSIVAFSGKRQYLELMNLRRGMQPATPTYSILGGGGVSDSGVVHQQPMEMSNEHHADELNMVSAVSTNRSQNTSGDANALSTLMKHSRHTAEANGGKGSSKGSSAAAKAPKKVTTVPLGPQSVRPPGWPLPDTTEVWVLTSTSGASALTNAAREAPYIALSQRLSDISWPRNITLSCLGTERLSAVCHCAINPMSELPCHNGQAECNTECQELVASCLLT